MSTSDAKNITTGITAATPYALSALSFYNQVSTCTEGKQVQFPAAPYLHPQKYTVRNDGVGNLVVLPPTGGNWNGATADLGFYVAPGSSCSFVFTTALAGYTCDYYGNPVVRAITTAQTAATLGLSSGHTLLISNASGADITHALPAPTVSSGLKFKFAANTSTFTSNEVKIEATGANLLKGCVMNAAVNTNLAAQTRAIFNHAEVLQGDWIELVSNGKVWHVSGKAGTAGAITAS